MKGGRCLAGPRDVSNGLEGDDETGEARRKERSRIRRKERGNMGPWAMGRAGSLSLGAASSLLGREQGQGVAGGSEEGLTLAASRSPSSSYEASTSSVCLHLCTVMIKYITMSSPSMRLGQKMEDGQWSSRPRQTPLFLGQPSPLQPCGTVLYLYKYP